MGSATSVSRRDKVDSVELAQCSADEVAAYVAQLGDDLGNVAEQLRKNNVNGEKLSLHRSYDVNGLAVFLELFVSDTDTRQRLVDELEKVMYRRSESEERELAARLRSMMAGSSAMLRCAGIENTEMNAMDEATKRVTEEKRRQRARDMARLALEKLSELPPEERALPRYQGALELYSDANQVKRAALRTDPAIVQLLEQWWVAASTLFGSDGTLTKSQYSEFHGSLVTILEAAGDWDSSRTQDYKDILEEDFASDSRGDLFTRADFIQGVFELCDQWTATVEKTEYLKFLRLGYDAVFGDLVSDDKPKVPDALSNAYHLEVVGIDAYDCDELDTDRMPWLESPELIVEGPLDVVDASDVVADADELCHELEYEEDAHVRRRSFDGVSPSRRRSLDATASKKKTKQSQPRRASFEARFDAAEDVREPERTPTKVDMTKRLSDLARRIPGKVVLLPFDQNAAVLAKQISKAASYGAVAAVVASGSHARVPKRIVSNIPVVTVSSEVMAKIKAYGKVRSRLVKFAHVRRQHVAMPVYQCVEVIADILNAKKDDMPLQQFVAVSFRRRYGNSRPFHKKYRSFLLGLLNELDQRTASTDDDAHALVSLFAQLCGVGTKTGRVVPLPPAATRFVVDHYHLLEPVLAETAKRIPTASRTATQRKVTSARAAKLVGYLLQNKARAVTHRALTRYLRLSKFSEAYKIAMGAYRALITTVHASDTDSLNVVPCPALLSLLAVTYTASDCPDINVEALPDDTPNKPRGGGGSSLLLSSLPKKVTTPFR